MKKWRISISVKLIALILSTLIFSVTLIVINATNLFKKDNLNNIYLTSELITASKAGEIRYWLDSVVKRGALIGSSLLEGLHQPNPANIEKFNGDEELLFVAIFDSENNTPHLAAKWLNLGLSAGIQLLYSEFEQMLPKLQIPWSDIKTDTPTAQIQFTPSHQSFLVVYYPTTDEHGKNHIMLIGIYEKFLVNLLSDSGPYNLELMNHQGTVIAGKDSARLSMNLIKVPLVKHMLTSHLNRELQEFQVDSIAYLGTYAKLGFAGLALISQVPRHVAFETGEILVRKSILISLFVSSAIFILAYYWLNSLVSPILVLQSATQEISMGNFGIRVHVKSRDELLDLADSFNEMCSDIQNRISNLSRMNEAALIISSTLEAQKLLQYSLETLMDLLKCSRALAWHESQEMLVAKMNWFEDSSVSLGPLKETIGNLDHPAQLTFENSTLLVAPLREKTKITGYFILAERIHQKPFQNEDLLILGTVLSSAGSSFENINLLKETADKARMEKELETAKHVQETMFPPREIRIPPVEIQSYYSPAAECGGDWWGCVELPGDQILLAVGDATGHGAPAAMVTATAKAVVSVLHSIIKHSPTAALHPRLVLHYLNKAVYESTRGKILMTFFIAVANLKTREITFATASHDPIYWYKRPSDFQPGSPGVRAQLDTLNVEPGPRLGQYPEAMYNEAKIQMSPGDFLLLYTDGLPEGLNTSQEEYGERKFLRSIIKNAHLNTAEIRDAILNEFNDFIGKEPLHDDITLAVFQYQSENPQKS